MIQIIHCSTGKKRYNDFMIGEFSPFHWLLVIVAGLILFGSKRLPEVGRSLGRSISEFKKGLREEEKETGAKPEETPRP